MNDPSDLRTGEPRENDQELQREGVSLLAVGIFFVVLVAFIVWHRFK